MPSKTSFVAPDYTWDEKLGRYRNAATGRFVSSSTIRAACQTTADVAAQNMTALGAQLRAGELTLAEWQTGMMREIKILHTAQAAAARGGWAQMSQADWGYTGSLIKKQYQYLDQFAADIASGKQPLDGRIDARCRMYGKAGYGTYEQMERRYQETNNGMTEERRIRTASESCEDCIEYSDRGWVPIGSLPRIGESRCRTNCACHFQYRRQSPGGGWVTTE